MERADNRCEQCGRPASHVHHLTYIRKFNERLDDLKALCEECHEGIHRPANTTRPVERTRDENHSRRVFFERLARSGCVLEYVRMIEYEKLARASATQEGVLNVLQKQSLKALMEYANKGGPSVSMIKRR